MKEGWRGNRGRRWGLTSVDCGKAPKLAKRHNGKGEPEAAPKMLSKKTGLWSLPICHWRPASQQPSSSSISSYRFTSADEISTNRRGSRLSGARHMQHKAISPRPFSPERPVPNPKKKTKVVWKERVANLDCACPLADACAHRYCVLLLIIQGSDKAISGGQSTFDIRGGRVSKG